MNDFRIKCPCRPEYVFHGGMNCPEPESCILCGSADAEITRCGPDLEMFETVRAVFGPEVREIEDPMIAARRSESFPIQYEAPDGLIYDDWWQALNV